MSSAQSVGIQPGEERVGDARGLRFVGRPEQLTLEDTDGKGRVQTKERLDRVKRPATLTRTPLGCFVAQLRPRALPILLQGDTVIGQYC